MVPRELSCSGSTGPIAGHECRGLWHRAGEDGQFIPLDPTALYNCLQAASTSEMQHAVSPTLMAGV